MLRIFILASAFLFLFVQCSTESNHRRGEERPVGSPSTEHDNGDPEKYLPEPNSLKHWKASGTPSLYRGEDLFVYINGGAEIYHEYGFRQVFVQEYKSIEGGSISLEIYEMEDEQAAYGIYTFKRGKKGEPLDLGKGGMLEGYYINFWKGPFLVTLTGQEENSDTVNGLKVVAQAVDARIPSGGKPPSLVKMLVKEGLIQESIKYLAGRLGLLNCYFFFPGNPFDFHEAVTGEYKKGCRVFVFKYKDSLECSQRYASVRTEFKSSPRYTFLKGEGNSFAVVDRDQCLIYVQSFEPYIIIVMGAGGQHDAEAMVMNMTLAHEECLRSNLLLDP